MNKKKAGRPRKYKDTNERKSSWQKKQLEKAKEFDKMVKIEELKIVKCLYCLRIGCTEHSEADLIKKILETRFETIKGEICSNFADVEQGAKPVFHRAIAYYETHLNNENDFRLFLTIEDLEETDLDKKCSDVCLSDDYVTDNIDLENLDIQNDLNMNFNPATIEF